MFTYFAQNFLLPLLAAVGAGIVLLLLGGVKWSVKKHFAITLPVVLMAFGLCWFVTKTSEPAPRVIIAGRIVNDKNESVDQAIVTVSNGNEQAMSDDNGNFKLDVTGRFRPPETVEIHVNKTGYTPYNGMTQVPSQDFIIHLHRL